MLYQQHVDEVG